MVCAVRKINTANTTNLTKIRDERADLKGFAATNTTAAAVFLKFFWHQPTAAVPIPALGTTVPDITITIPALGTTSGTVSESWPDGLTKSGELWLAVTNLVADNDNTAVAAGAAVISVFYE